MIDCFYEVLLSPFLGNFRLAINSYILHQNLPLFINHNLIHLFFNWLSKIMGEAHIADKLQELLEFLFDSSIFHELSAA